MDIGKPKKVLEIEEPAVPYRGKPVPEKVPQRQPEPVQK